VDGLLLEVRQQRVEDVDKSAGAAVVVPDARHLLRGIGAVVDGEADLLDVVGALHASRRLADFLNGGGQEAEENGNDGNHDQQFDEREAGTGEPTASQRSHGNLQNKGQDFERKNG